MTEFREPSPQAINVRRGSFKRKHNLPFATVPLGKSFPVGKSQFTNVQALRVLTSREGLKLGRCFRVIIHENEYEVFFHAVRETKPVTPDA